MPNSASLNECPSGRISSLVIILCVEADSSYLGKHSFAHLSPQRNTMPDLSTPLQSQSSLIQLSEDQILDLLYLARTGSLQELKEDLQALALRDTTTPAQILQATRDPHTGNTIAHYAAANGHTLILSYIQDIENDECLATDGTSSNAASSLPNLFQSANAQGSTPLHYAAVNGQEKAVETLLGYSGPAQDKEKLGEYVEKTNHAGRTARDEADLQGAGKEEWLKVAGQLEKYESENSAEVGKEEDADAVEGEEVRENTERDVEKVREGVGGVDMDS